MRYNVFRTELRGPGLLGPNATLEYRALRVNQPLILQREPTNEKDANAVIAITVLAQPVAYVAKECAAIISPLMSQGKIFTCTVRAVGRAFRYPQVEITHLLRQDAYARQLHVAGAHESMVRAVLAGRYCQP